MPVYANPFQITKPVEPGDVIDRNDEARRLTALAEEGNNARLVAPRRFGKTSLVQRVQSELAKIGWRTVYVDLLGIVTLDDIAVRIERAYVGALGGTLKRWYAGVQRTLTPTASVGGGPVPANASFDLSARARDRLIERLALPLKVRERSGDRVHIVYDEFQELESVDSHVDAIFRSEIQHHGVAASYVFAGSRVRMMEMLFADRKRAFYGQTQPVQLRPLGPDDLGEYVVERFEETGKSIGAEALGALLDLVQGHPQRAMLVAHALWDATGDEAGPEEWESARADSMEAVNDELRTTWTSLTPRERQTLVAIASGESAFSRRRGGGGGSVTAALGRLEGEGAIVREGSYWRVVDPLLAEWVREGRM